MPLLYRVIFCASIFLLSLYGMIVVHESGHALGAVLTGGEVDRLVVHPLSISQVYLSSNPHPLIVVWCGPLVGCAIPLCLSTIVPTRFFAGKRISQFFSGLCCLLNGAYISAGPFTDFGDCGEMLRTGTPLWAMVLFGVAAISLGVNMLQKATSRPTEAEDLAITPRLTIGAVVALALAVTAGTILSSR